MTPRPRFTLTFAPETLEHLDFVERKYHSLIQKTINEQLSHTPEKITRNRKPLDQPAPFDATWELRFGPNNRFRVLYEVEGDEQIVWVLAVGIKEGNKLVIGGEEFEA
ncbi:MAG: addiction module toxin RelE [Anaerolineae bacterium]|nr:type II toxin-antitoxin system RelE/ParE family toxin [Anaerolineales bacterium]MCQ3975744.1 addiction module toxin RelE [Anaerolineae bacterium]